MYNSAGYSLGASAAAGGLAYTGFESVYAAMAAFALIAAGSAMMRVAPVLRSPRARRRREMLDL